MTRETALRYLQLANKYEKLEKELLHVMGILDKIDKYPDCIIISVSNMNMKIALPYVNDIKEIIKWHIRNLEQEIKQLGESEVE